MLTLAAAAAKAAWMNTIEDAISTYPFLVKGVSFSGEQIIPTFYNSASLTYKDRTKLTSVHNVNSRIHDETKQAVENIIVELELGGTKADLERLLAEIETALPVLGYWAFFWLRWGVVVIRRSVFGK